MAAATIAVARLTYANGVRQPLTWLVVVLGVALVALSYLFGMFSFEDHNRMRVLGTAGIASSLLLGLFIGVVSAAQAVHDELASRTALTLFAKPMNRSSFLLGKVFGVLALVATVMAAVMVVHLAAVLFAQRVGFDLEDTHRPYHRVEDVGFVPWGRLIAGHALAFMANGVMVALAAVLSLRFPLVVTVIICFSAFVGAHLLASIGLGMAVLLPSLHLYNIDDALHFQDMPITPAYFILCAIHALLYGAACLVIGLAFFQRQDIP